MLRKIIILVLFCVAGISISSYAQDKQPDPQLRAIKVGLLSERMKLSPQQSEKFWPVYYRYEDEMRQVWRSKKALNDPKNTSKTKVDELQKLEEKKVQIRGKYKNEFLRVISTDQLAAMYQAETEFVNMLLNRLGKK